MDKENHSKHYLKLNDKDATNLLKKYLLFQYITIATILFLSKWIKSKLSNVLQDTSVVFIRNAERCDSGKYELAVQVQDLVAKAVVEVAVVEAPSKPRKPTIVEVCLSILFIFRYSSV